MNTIIRCISLSLFTLMITANVVNAATLATNGFEGVSGELPYTSSVEQPANGVIITTTAPNPVFAGTQSLQFDKINTQNQIDFDVVFDTVDVSNFTDVALEFYWHPNINNNGYEQGDDSLTFTIAHDGTGVPTVLTFDANALNAARDVNSTDEWQQILASIPDDATVLDFSFNANFNANAEDFFFDQLIITGTEVAVPEPASLALWSLLGLVGVGFALWRRRRRG